MFDVTKSWIQLIRVESADSGACIQSDSSYLLNPYKKLTMKDLNKSKAQRSNKKVYLVNICI